MGKRIVKILIGIIIFLGVGVGAWFFLRPTSHPAPHPSTTAQSPPKEDQLACTESLPLSVQIAQKVMFAGYSSLLASERSTFQSSSVGGVILMDQIDASAIASFTNGFAIPPIIAVDQEGGTVQRYTSEGLLPGAEDMVTYPSAQAYQLYLHDDQYLKSIGITTNFAPVVDVLSAQTNPLPGRIYSNDPQVVTTYASQAVKASQAVGITPVIKHFPGLGSASGNTDFGSAVTDPLSVLMTRDIIPYQQLAHFKPDVMVSNAIVPGLTNNQPASLSPAAVSLLRSMYPNALVYTDSLTAAAVPGTIDNAAVAAWEAGIDIDLIVQKSQDTNQLPTDISSIVSAAESALQSGSLDKTKFAESVLHILQRKQVDPCQLNKNTSS